MRRLQALALVQAAEAEPLLSPLSSMSEEAVASSEAAQQRRQQERLRSWLRTEGSLVQQNSNKKQRAALPLCHMPLQHG